MDWTATIFYLFASLTMVTEQKSGTIENTSFLSRRKRYLKFPEGSSFQLVYCVQIISLNSVDETVLFANTAALAWQLPTDPDLLTMISDKAVRRADARYPTEKQAKRKQLINPVFNKRSVDEQKVTFKEKLKIKMDRIKMHERQLDREYLNRKHMNERSIEFHRKSRVGFYEKIEKFINAIGTDGRQCVLRQLCESARIAPQGTFQQELLRVAFTLPKGKEFELEEHKEYDEAHNGNIEDCYRKYPECEPIAIS